MYDILLDAEALVDRSGSLCSLPVQKVSGKLLNKLLAK
jgi:hypothetical protein